MPSSNIGRWMGAWVLCFALGFTLRASDTTVTESAFLSSPESEGVTPYHLKGSLHVHWPSEVTKTVQPSYTLVWIYVTAEGKAMQRFYCAPNGYFEQAVASAYDYKEFEPAVRNGKPIDSICWNAVIYNPASAKEKGTDTTPRLLVVTPVIVKKGLISGDKAYPVWATLRVDETGTASLLKFDEPSREPFRAVIEATLPNWRFAPAKKAGVAQTSEVHLALQVQMAPRYKPEVKQTLPKVVRQVKPVYPLELRASRMIGQVDVDFIVNAEGKVENPVVVSSTSPAFNQPAMDAILKWKFEPGTRDGKPTAIKMRQPISFSLEGGGSEAVEITRNRHVPELPEEYRYDVTPKPKGVLYPVYPYSLLRDGVGGKAKVAIQISEFGDVIGVRVDEATKAEFGLALTAALDAFKFEAALKNGKPVTSFLSMEFEFDTGSGTAGSPAPEDRSLLKEEKKHPEKFVLNAKLLDQPLKPISQRRPVFPTGTTQAEGSATIETLIDTDGYARLPRVVKASEPGFGYSAAQAVSTWRFEPPKIKGDTVVVRVQIPFGFNMKDKEKPKAEKEGEKSN